MSAIKKPKYEVAYVTIPNGGIQDQVYNVASPGYLPDKTYDFITGVRARVLTLANQVYVNLQLLDGAGNVVLDPMEQNTLAFDSSVPAEERFIPVRIPCNGQIVKPGAIAPLIGNPAAPNANVVIQFIFRLEDTLEEIART